jgi:hypothetical protein
MTQPSFSGQWFHPAELGYVRRYDLSTPQVEAWQSPDGKVHEWEIKGREAPKVFIDDAAGLIDRTQTGLRQWWTDRECEA